MARRSFSGLGGFLNFWPCWWDVRSLHFSSVPFDSRIQFSWHKNVDWWYDHEPLENWPLVGWDERSGCWIRSVVPCLQWKISMSMSSQKMAYGMTWLYLACSFPPSEEFIFVLVAGAHHRKHIYCCPRLVFNEIHHKPDCKIGKRIKDQFLFGNW